MSDISDTFPDFIGTWDENDLELGLNSGEFLMYIHERIDDGSVERISGTIIDRYGTAKFTGDLSDIHMDFTVTYDSEAVAEGAYPHPIRHVAKNYGLQYCGKYELINKQGRPQAHPFIIMKYVNPSLN